MWEVVDKVAAKRKRVKQDTSVRFGENVPIQEEKRTDKPKLSYEDTKVYYSLSSSSAPTQTLPVTILPFSVFTSRLEASPSRGVIQRKQTTPLTVRLREQGIEADSFGPEIAELIGLYDNLDNESATESLQKDYLNSLLGMLNIRLVSEAESSQVRIALRIVQDELDFVNVQTYDTPLEAPQGAWEHMSASPFFKMIAEIAHMQLQIPLGSFTSGIPDTDTSPQQEFSSFNTIRELSRHHIESLESPDKIPVIATNWRDKIRNGFRFLARQPVPTDQQRSQEAFMNTYQRIKDMLEREGMLSHYSHNPNLSVLHSTNYLKANHILKREKLSKSDTVSEGENVSKSQEVDTSIFRNTGFVFFFLERAGSTHRSKTDFGKYRYTVRLADNSNILNNAWAILHDMAGLQSSDRAIRKESPVRRIIKRPLKWFDLFGRHQKGSNLFLTSEEDLTGMLSMFLPSANQTFYLQTSDKKSYDTRIEDHLSGNFLQGQDIINGIALRIAHELMALWNCSEEEYKLLMSDDNAFWEYVAGVVHDMQIMVPQDVLPEQYDFIEDQTMHVEPIMPSGTLRHIPGNAPDAEALLLSGMNNCFFDAMFPLIDHESLGVANAVELRRYFTLRQQEQGGDVLPNGAPVEYQHVQQFADIFGIAITVIAMGRDQNPVMIDFIPRDRPFTNHYYIRFLVPQSEDGIGHYTNF